MIDILRGMIRYSFADILEDGFSGLTEKERAIVGTEKNYQKLVEFSQGGSIPLDDLIAEEERDPKPFHEVAQRRMRIAGDALMNAAIEELGNAAVEAAKGD